MSNGLLEILRYFLLALLWLFFLYAARMVLVDVQRTKRAASSEGEEHELGEHNRGLRLRIVEPKQRRGETTNVFNELTVGRSPACSICLDDDAFASSIHARVFVADGSAYLEDLGSKNGTYVNGHPITTTVPIERGDHIRVGGTIFEVRR